MPQHLLVDVRSPAEFSTGPLVSDIAPTVNIEYTAIDALADVYAQQQQVTVSRDDHITLYCRSGRRSGIAKRRLEELGYTCVRDIGGLEEARRVLDRETVGRQLGLEEEGREETVGEKGEKGDGRKGVRKEGLERLLKGLEACEE